MDFDLNTGRELNGLGRIRRIRMPCATDAAVSMCSTFLQSENGLSLPLGPPSAWRMLR